MNKLSRIPILNGDIYCSPSCGAHCKKAKHNEAVRLSSELATRLGIGWKPEVWENLGWYWAVTKGVCSIFPMRSGGYTIYLNVRPQIVLHGECPEDLVNMALNKAREHITQTKAELAEVEV